MGQCIHDLTRALQNLCCPFYTEQILLTWYMTCNRNPTERIENTSRMAERLLQPKYPKYVRKQPSGRLRDDARILKPLRSCSTQSSFSLGGLTVGRTSLGIYTLLGISYGNERFCLDRMNKCYLVSTIRQIHTCENGVFRRNKKIIGTTSHTQSCHNIFSSPWPCLLQLQQFCAFLSLWLSGECRVLLVPPDSYSSFSKLETQIQSFINTSSITERHIENSSIHF